MLQVVGQVFIPFSYWGCNNISGTFVDDTDSEFNAGSMTNMSWNGASLTLNVGSATGTYISRPFEKSTRCAQPPPTIQAFTRFGWVPNLPYGKELPATNETTTNYVELANSTLLNNLLHVWHLNGTGAVASGTAIPAQTGTAGKAGQGNGTGFTYAASGKLNSALTFDGVDDFVEIVGYTQTSVSDYTISVWVRTNATGNRVFVENRGSGAGRSLTLAMGTNPGGCTSTDGRVSFGVDSDSIYIGRCMSSGSINDNNWHHIVGVWDGTSGAAVTPAQFTIYIDGVAASVDDRIVGALNAPLTGLSHMKLARHDPWSVRYAGSMDEVAIWNRVLSATEVRQLYQRGANRLRFQVRSCILPNCSDNPTWLGPDGSSSSYFTEMNNNTIPTTGLGVPRATLPEITFSDYPFLVLPNTSFFQYMMIMETDNTNIVPSVRAVSASY